MATINKSIHPVLRQSLAKQDTCPACGASWKTLLECMHDVEPANRVIALIIMDNCQVCRAYVDLNTLDKEVI